MRLLPLLLLLAACSRQGDGVAVTASFNPFYLGMGFIGGHLLARLRRKDDGAKYFDTFIIGLGVVMMVIGYSMKT